MVKIKQVIIFSEKLYQGGTYVQNNIDDSNILTIQITNKKDMKINLFIKVLVGMSLFNTDFQVFEFSKVIPKYCFYILLRDFENEYNDDLNHGVIFNLNIRRDRLLIWIQENFNIGIQTLELFIAGDNYNIRFRSLRTDKLLEIYMRDNEIRILTDEIELAGNIFQDMCQFFQVKDLDSIINYPDNVSMLDESIKKVQKLDSSRNKFSINMTDIISQIKDLFVRCEDNRLIEDFDGFSKYFNKINIKNQEILDEFNMRSKIYKDLMEELKTVNNIIQQFSNLKCGEFKNKLVLSCRQCIKDRDYDMLLKVIHGN